MPVSSTFGKGTSNPVQALKRDLKDATTRTTEHLQKLEEEITQQAAGNGISEEVCSAPAVCAPVDNICHDELACCLSCEDLWAFGGRARALSEQRLQAIG